MPYLPYDLNHKANLYLITGNVHAYQSRTVIWTHSADYRSLPACPEQSDISQKVIKG